MNQTNTAELTVPVDSERDHTHGTDDAPVTLVQYGDFECPNCGDTHPVIKRLQDRLGTRLRFVYRHFPLSQIHPHANHAAEAAEAAAEQGEFWRMHDKLYENQDALSDSDLKNYASELDLDVERFEQELDTREHEPAVKEDLTSGARSGVNGTPTFFINGERYNGPLEFESLLWQLAAEGDFNELLSELDSDNYALRETIDRSRRGAPAGGATIRDRFSADEIFQRIVATADEEFTRSSRLLFFSGLAAGLCITLSFFARAVLTAAVLGPSAALLGNLAYPIGFAFIVMGRYQLYTENTLTPVTLVMTRVASVPLLLRVWGIVLLANVLGAAIGAFLLANTAIFSPEVATVAAGFGEHALSMSISGPFFQEHRRRLARCRNGLVDPCCTRFNHSFAARVRHHVSQSPPGICFTVSSVPVKYSIWRSRVRPHCWQHSLASSYQ